MNPQILFIFNIHACSHYLKHYCNIRYKNTLGRFRLWQSPIVINWFVYLFWEFHWFFIRVCLWWKWNWHSDLIQRIYVEMSVVWAATRAKNGLEILIELLGNLRRFFITVPNVEFKFCNAFKVVKIYIFKLGLICRIIWVVRCTAAFTIFFWLFQMTKVLFPQKLHPSNDQFFYISFFFPRVNMMIFPSPLKPTNRMQLIAFGKVIFENVSLDILRNLNNSISNFDNFFISFLFS